MWVLKQLFSHLIGAQESQLPSETIGFSPFCKGATDGRGGGTGEGARAAACFGTLAGCSDGAAAAPPPIAGGISLSSIGLPARAVCNNSWMC